MVRIVKKWTERCNAFFLNALFQFKSTFRITITSIKINIRLLYYVTALNLTSTIIWNLSLQSGINRKFVFFGIDTYH